MPTRGAFPSASRKEIPVLRRRSATPINAPRKRHGEKAKVISDIYRKCSTEHDHVLGRQFRRSSFDRAVRRKPMVRQMMTKESKLPLQLIATSSTAFSIRSFPTCSFGFGNVRAVGQHPLH